MPHLSLLNMTSVFVEKLNNKANLQVSGLSLISYKYKILIKYIYNFDDENVHMKTSTIKLRSNNR